MFSSPWPTSITGLHLGKKMESWVCGVSRPVFWLFSPLTWIPSTAHLTAQSLKQKEVNKCLFNTLNFTHIPFSYPENGIQIYSLPIKLRGWSKEKIIFEIIYYYKSLINNHVGKNQVIKLVAELKKKAIILCIQYDLNYAYQKKSAGKNGRRYMKMWYTK